MGSGYGEIGSRWPLFLLGFVAIALFVNYNFAPWELAYRQRAAVVIRARLDALPTVNGVEADSYLTEGKDDILILVQYPRETFCDTVIGHYRQVTPANGWTFDRREQARGDTIDHYFSIFGGYHLSLTLECDPAHIGYDISGSVPFPYDFALVGWATGAR
jgi:hypothetical protein